MLRKWGSVGALGGLLLLSTGKPVRAEGDRQRIVRVDQELPNPGKYEHYNLETRELFQLDAFTGARADVNLQLAASPAKVFQVGFATFLPVPDQFNPNKAVTEFLVNLQGNNPLYLLMAQYNPTAGRVSGRAVLPLFKLQDYSFKSNFQLQPGGRGQNMLNVGVDRKGGDNYSHLNARLVEHQPANVSLAYIQSLTRTHALGAELSHTLDHDTGVTLVYKYKSDGFDKSKEGATASVQASTRGLEIAYARKVNESLLLGAELQFAPQPTPFGEVVINSRAAAGAQYRYNTFQFNALAEGDGRLNVHLIRMVEGTPCAVMFHGEVNPFTSDSKFGVGFRFN